MRLRPSNCGRNNGFLGAGIPQQDVIEARAAGFFRNSEPGGRISLGIGVNDQDAKVVWQRGGAD